MDTQQDNNNRATGTFVPSPYQQGVYDFITNTNPRLYHGARNAVINAVAGSGKTTTIVNALRVVPSTDKVLFLAFNKSIVEELQGRVGDLPNVTVKTLHSLGYGALKHAAWRRAGGNDSEVVVDAEKYHRWVRAGLKEGTVGPEDKNLSRENMATWRSNVYALIDLARCNLAATRGDIQATAWKHGIVTVDNEAWTAWRAVAWGRTQQTVVDYTDMVYLPATQLSITVPYYDWVFIDECQDLNAAQRRLFLQTVRTGTGRWIAVGDPRQAIYGFAGADAESFDKLAHLPETTTLPLSVCYRCGSDIVDAARAWVPAIEPRGDAPTGRVNYGGSIGEIEDGDMVLCRMTAPLVQLCLQFIGEGRKATIKGRDIGANLVTLLENTGETLWSEASVRLNRRAVDILHSVTTAQGCSAKEAEANSAVRAYQDKLDTLYVLAEGLTRVQQIVDRINAIFTDNDCRGVCFSTVHKAKGLEADRVFILCPDLFGLPWAVKTPRQKVQEDNLQYVAVTRAKNYLAYVVDYKWERK